MKTPVGHDYCVGRTAAANAGPCRRTDAKNTPNYANNTDACGTFLNLCLTRPNPDRGHELVAAIVAGPVVIDTTLDVEPGFLGDQQDAAAARAFRPAQIFTRKGPGQRQRLARALDEHRRSSSTFRHRTPYGCHSTRRLWRGRDAAVKVSWRLRYAPAAG